MIIKRGQKIKGLVEFRRESRNIWAMRMREAFTYETGQGWMPGRSGDWLVLVAGDLWAAIEDNQFKSIFGRAEGTAPCDGCRDMNR